MQLRHRTGFCPQSGPHQPSISPDKALAGLSNMMAAWVGAALIEELIPSTDQKMMSSFFGY